MATNELRGRVSVKAGGKEYTFHFGFEAVKQLEQLFGVKGWSALGDKCDNFGDWSVEEQLEVIRIGLSRMHPDLTDEQLEEIAFATGERGLLRPAVDAVVAGGKQIVGDKPKPPGVGQPDPPKKAPTGKAS